jgi:hypothetical protein
MTSPKITTPEQAVERLRELHRLMPPSVFGEIADVVEKLQARIDEITSAVKSSKMDFADVKFQRDALLEMTWLDLPGEPYESTEGWERRD